METTPAKKQVDFLAPFAPLLEDAYRYLIFFGGRYSAKSYHIALALLLRSGKSKLRILCTREIQNTIKDSVHKLLKDQIELYGFPFFEVTSDSIINKATGSEFVFKGLKHNITEIKSMEGIDICWIEEAQNVTYESLDILIPTIRKEGSQVIVSFNRYLELDPVYVRFVQNERPNSYVCEVNYSLLERNGMMTDVIRQELETDRAEDADLFAYKWLGQPLNQADNAIIGRADVLEAMKRTVPLEGAVEVGVDVARLGNDKTVFYKRKGLGIIGSEIYKKQRITVTEEKLINFIGGEKDKVLLKIDDTGVGGGLTDNMMRGGYRVMPVNFGEDPIDKDKYPNLISEAWFYFASIIGEVALPYDSELLMQLTSRLWLMDSSGRRGVESKKDYKKRGFKSPDLADALIICFYTSRIGTFTKPTPKQDEEYHEEPTQRVSTSGPSGFSGLLDKRF